MDKKQTTISTYKLTIALSILFLTAVIVNIFVPIRSRYSLDILFAGEVASESSENVANVLDVSPTLLPDVTVVAPVVTTPVQTPAPVIPAKYNGGEFLLVGDSLMLTGFGPILESSLLKYQDVSVVRLGKYSTGLNRIDYYDWYANTESAIAKYKPDYLIVMFGANDGQTIRDSNGKSYSLYSSGWPGVYATRVYNYINQFAGRLKMIYWIGQPIPANNDFLRKFSLMNPVYQSECAKFANCTYVDMWSRFAVNGKYSALVADQYGKKGTVKSSDGVHVTQHGGEIMVEEVLKAMTDNFELTLK